MPKGSKVGRCVQGVLAKGKVRSKGSAIRACPVSTKIRKAKRKGSST